MHRNNGQSGPRESISNIRLYLAAQAFSGAK
jgi:hypothetical protein